MKTHKKNVQEDFLTESLLKWYETFGRSLPWRLLDENLAKRAYKVWVSEIMLQQTTVATVTDYFLKFMLKWPTIEALAAASLEEIYHHWQGLGYYARARNMHKCAQVIVQDYRGCFPSSEAELLKLPGIGPYTAAALRAIAFNEVATVVDGNVERVMTRLYAIKDPLPSAKPLIKKTAKNLTSHFFPGNYAQAIMDLGATVCSPRKPNCLQCPWQSSCKAYLAGNPEIYPYKTPKPLKPTRYAYGLWIQNQENEILLRRRPEKGLLGGLVEVPTTAWLLTKGLTLEETLVEENYAEIKGLESLLKAGTTFSSLKEEVKHTFTHFHLKISILFGKLLHEEALGASYFWVKPKEFSNYPIPTLMKKVIKQALLESKALQ